MSLVDNKGWQGGIASVAQTRSSVTATASAPTTIMTTTRRNMGGRRPAKNSGVSATETLCTAFHCMWAFSALTA